MPTLPAKHKPRTAAAKRHGTRDTREHAAKRGYNWQWQKFRKQFLIKNPLCRHCQDNGFLVPANEVDHIIPHRGNKKLFWDLSNLQPLCKSCHSKKTRKEQELCLV